GSGHFDPDRRDLPCNCPRTVPSTAHTGAGDCFHKPFPELLRFPVRPFVPNPPALSDARSSRPMLVARTGLMSTRDGEISFWKQRHSLSSGSALKFRPPFRQPAIPSRPPSKRRPSQLP